MPRKLSRRDLLKTGAIATAGIGGLLAHPESAAARALSADVVVRRGSAHADSGEHECAVYAQLQPREPRVREVERDRAARHAVRAEPLLS